MSELKEKYKELALKVASHYSDEDAEALAKVALEEVERAKGKYDERERDYKFSTYLTYYFKMAIEKELEKQ